MPIIFFLECGTNLVAKVEMHDKITDILSDKGLVHLLDIDRLLYGSDQLSLEENKQVFNHVQHFIKESNRFANKVLLHCLLRSHTTFKKGIQ